MNPYPGKYVVFKADHLETQPPWDVAPIEDCVVIRFQDIFSGPALSEYANQILSTVEVARIIGADPDKLIKLERLSDFFFEAAERARHYHIKKIPD